MSFEIFQESPVPRVNVMYGAPPELPAPVEAPKPDRTVAFVVLAAVLYGLYVVVREDYGHPDILPNDWR